MKDVIISVEDVSIRFNLAQITTEPTKHDKQSAKIKIIILCRHYGIFAIIGTWIAILLVKAEGYKELQKLGGSRKQRTLIV